MQNSVPADVEVKPFYTVAVRILRRIMNSVGYVNFYIGR